jgi:ABC-type spermidine/putrescine transport system permease subunit II
MHTSAIVVPLSCLQHLARTGQRQEAAGVQANRPQAAVERLGNFQELFEDRGFRISLCNAPVYVSIVAPASVASALALMIEAAPRGRALFRAMFFLPVALGLILAYGAVDDLRATWLFILAGHVVFCLPFMVRAVLAVLLALDLKGLEEAAQACGTSWTQRFLGVVLPNIRGGILVGNLMVVTLRPASST